jgi:hypothetical protein
MFAPTLQMLVRSIECVANGIVINYGRASVDTRDVNEPSMRAVSELRKTLIDSAYRWKE